jgi:cystathionine beta-synthase
MMKMGYLDKSGITAADLVGSKQSNLITVEGTTAIGEVAMMMQQHNFSQMPVTEEGRIVGAISESRIMHAVVEDPGLKNKAVKEIMQNAFPFADISTPVDALSKMITHDTPAVLVKDFKVDKTYIITRYDIINALTA